MQRFRLAYLWFFAFVALISALDGWAPTASGLGIPGYRQSELPKTPFASLVALNSDDDDDHQKLTWAPVGSTPPAPRLGRPHPVASGVSRERPIQIRRHALRAAPSTGPPRIAAPASA